MPALMPKLPMGKERKSGLRPDLRAEIPDALASWIAGYFSRIHEARAKWPNILIELLN